MTRSEHTEARASDALRVAQLYYLQDWTMDEIAADMKISRSSVSRLVAHAREIGLVQITVRSPNESSDVIAQRLGERLGISVHVVPSPSRASDTERLERTARAAARILTMTVDANSSIGVAWGATTSAVGRHLPTKHLHNSLVVQMNGAANETTSGITYSATILERYGQAFGSHVQLFPVPALFDDPHTKQLMWRERSIRRVLDAQARVGLFVFGLGSPKAQVPSHVYNGDYLNGDDVTALLRDGVVGDCATVFYRADGSSDGIQLNQRSSGPPFETVRQIPRRVCVVSSRSKLEALEGALRAGLVTELVVDESLARALLNTPLRTP